MVTPIKKQTSVKKGNIENKTKQYFIFNKDNYIFMLIGLGITILGYILMIGGGSDDPNVFNPAIFDFQRLTLSPILIMGGMLVQIYAIMKKRKDEDSAN